MPHGKTPAEVEAKEEDKKNFNRAYLTKKKNVNKIINAVGIFCTLHAST